VNNALDVKENYEHALDFVFHLSCLFLSVSVSLMMKVLHNSKKLEV
jgi:hypothetical protein